MEIQYKIHSLQDHQEKKPPTATRQRQRCQKIQFFIQNMTEVSLEWVSILTITTLSLASMRTCKLKPARQNSTATSWLSYLCCSDCFNTGGKLPAKITETAEQTELLNTSPKYGLWTQYTTASVGHCRTIIKILLYSCWISHEPTNSSATNNSIP